MSFTKLSYDDCAYRTNLSQNVGLLSYNLDSVKFNSCNKCRHEVGLVGGTAVSHVSGNLVDLESNLFGIDREASKCATMKYLPRENETVGTKFYNLGAPNQVDTTMKHLPACQMHNVLGVPHPPPMQPYTCPKLN